MKKMLKSKHSTLFSSKKEINFILSILLVISPILSNYFLNINSHLVIGDLIIILLTLFFFLPKLTHDNLKLKKLIIFITLLTLLLVISNTFNEGNLKTFFYSIVFLILISLKRDDEVSNQFFTIYSKFGLFLSFFLFAQFAIHLLFDYRLVLNLPFTSVESDTLISLKDQFRPGSFFREPSYFVLFISP